MSLNILIVNQNDDLSAILGRFLRSEGHRTSCLPCEPDSVPMIAQLSPDLIIIEIASSELLATEIISRLRNQRSSQRTHIPVIVISDFPALEFELPYISDFIGKPLDLERLRESMNSLTGGGRRKETRTTGKSLSTEEHKKFRDYLIKHSGLNFDRHNIRILERGLNSRITTLRIDSYNEYFRYLTGNTERHQELQKLLQLLTVGESFFFRQEGHFTALMEVVLPNLLEYRGNNSIRLLSAGCSTGEEPYSLAMTVMEALPDWKSLDIRILGADINNHSLMRALEGGYNSWKIRVTEKKYLDKYFSRIGDTYVVKDEVKSLVDFTYMDLQAGQSSSNRLRAESFDAIFCRNVMIYFPTETIRQVVESFATALKPGGYLFLGHAETLSHISTKFERQLEHGVFFYRKKGGQHTSIDRAQPAAPPVANAAILSGPGNNLPRQQPGSMSLPPEQGLDLDALYEEAIAHEQEKNYGTAKDLFRKILAINPEHKEAIVGEAMILAYGRRYQEALEKCNRALMIDDLIAGAYFVRGFAFEKTNRKTEAIDEYRKAILLKMDFVMPHYRLGKLYARTGRSKCGRLALKNSLKLLEQGGAETIIPYSGGLSREIFLEQLRDEIVRIDASPAA